MVSNPKAELYQMFPIPLYVTRYEGDMTEINKFKILTCKWFNPHAKIINETIIILKKWGKNSR